MITVHVGEGDSTPVKYSDGFFWRQGETTQKPRCENIRDFFRVEGAEKVHIPDRKAWLLPALQARLIEMTIPENRRSQAPW